MESNTNETTAEQPVREIPKLIHQIYITKTNQGISGKILEWINRTKAVNQGYEHRFWTSEQELEAFVAEKYPQYLIAYKMLPFDIQRYDLARLLVLYEFGGVYIDTDIECLRPFDALLQSQNMVLGLEPDEHARNFENFPYLVGSFFIASSPKNEFIKYLIDGILSGLFEKHSTHHPTQIMKSTGPAKITELYRKSQGRFSVSLIPSRFLSPLNQSQINDYLRGKYFAQVENSFMVHLYAGSWTTESENKLDIELKDILQKNLL
jgi:mannosyltransferase OCH1-like enzyme